MLESNIPEHEAGDLGDGDEQQEDRGGRAGEREKKSKQNNAQQHVLKEIAELVLTIQK